jgi:hypothetical protein
LARSVHEVNETGTGAGFEVNETGTDAGFDFRRSSQLECLTLEWK